MFAAPRCRVSARTIPEYHDQDSSPNESRGSRSAAGPNPLEARATVDRLIVARQERHHRLGATIGANGRVHLTLGARRPVASGRGSVSADAGPRAAVGPTLGAAPRFVHQSATGVKLLFASGEDEFSRTFPTRENLIAVDHENLRAASTGLGEGQRISPANGTVSRIFGAGSVVLDPNQRNAREYTRSIVPAQPRMQGGWAIRASGLSSL
jgi:hypothetical protein